MINSIQRKIKNVGYSATFKEVAGVIWSHYKVNSVLKLIDVKEFQRLDRQYNKSSIVGVGRKKYLQIKPWLTLNLRYIYMLGLNTKPRPLQILDIGTGFGYFPFLCSYFGHNALAIDLDHRALYNESVRLLGVERIPCKIEAFQPLPDFGVKFDLVTAFMVCFNNYGKGTQNWGIKEWDFFLDDLKANHMVDNGRIFLQLNAPMAHLGMDVRQLFREQGAVIDLGRVFFQFPQT